MNGKELLKALAVLSEEKGIDEEELFGYVESALNAAYKREYNATNSKVVIDKDTGDIRVFSYKKIVEEINPEEDEDSQVLLEELGDNKEGLKLGDEIEEEVTPKDFGRVATSTAKQVVVQKNKRSWKK